MNAKSTLPLVFALLGVAAGCGSNGDDPSQSSEATVSAAQCAAAAAWAANTTYATGTVVTYGGTTYECVQGHTALPGWTPDAVPALWRPVTCSGGGGSSSSSSGGSSG